MPLSLSFGRFLLLFFLFFLRIFANILDDELGEGVDLREDSRDKAISCIKLFVVLYLCGEVSDLVQLYLVALLGDDLEVLENLVEIAFGCLGLGLERFLVALLTVKSELLSNVVIVVWLGLLDDLFFLFETLVVFEGSKLSMGDADARSCLNESIHLLLVAIFASEGVELLIELIEQIVRVTFDLESLHFFAALTHGFSLHFAEQVLELLVREDLIISPISGLLFEILIKSGVALSFDLGG